MANDLVKAGTFELALDNSIMDALTEELGDDVVIPYDHVKIPSGGITAFEIPSDNPDEPEISKEITGVIVYAHDINAYWDSSYDGASNPPLCSSMNGKIGLTTDGEVLECKTCQFNQFGSKGRGKACKNMKRLYILRDGAALPIILTLPPTSIKAYKDYVARQIVLRKLRTHHVVTKITLKKETSGDGVVYSKAQFTKVSVLPAEMLPALDECCKGLKASAASVDIDLNEGSMKFTEDTSEDDDLPFK